MSFDRASLQIIQLTPPGRGAVATLRVEGAGAVETVQSHFHARGGRLLADCSTEQVVVGRFGGPEGEEVVVRRTGDDAVEIHCHGGTAVVAMIEETLIAAGGRSVAWRGRMQAQGQCKGDSPRPTDHAAHGARQCPAETKIGTVPAKIGTVADDDAIAAAALAALADARTERCAAILLDQYQGALRRAMDEIREAGERGETASARRLSDALMARAELGRHLTRPWRVVLAGRPNVGKSSLLNALAGCPRAIVHHAPGTTRDAVTVATATDGWPIELCDTAGLRPPCDAVERAGIEVAGQRLARADLVVLVANQNVSWSAEDQELFDRWPGAVLVHNKCDLPASAGERPTGLSTSALRGDGIDLLLDLIARRLVPHPPPPGAAVPFCE